jgi:hypothetical protein
MYRYLYEFISVYGLWYAVPPLKGGTPYGRVRFTDVQARPVEFLDLTSVTRDKFQRLVPPVEAVFQAPMAA